MKNEKRRYLLVKTRIPPKDVQRNIEDLEGSSEPYVKVIRLDREHVAVRCTHRSVDRIARSVAETLQLEVLKTSGTLKALRRQHCLGFQTGLST